MQRVAERIFFYVVKFLSHCRLSLFSFDVRPEVFSTRQFLDDKSKGNDFSGASVPIQKDLLLEMKLLRFDVNRLLTEQTGVIEREKNVFEGATTEDRLRAIS